MDGAFGTVGANHPFLFTGWLSGAFDIAAEHWSTHSFCLSSLGGDFPPHYGSCNVQPVNSPSLPRACIPVWMGMCPGSGPEPGLLFLWQVPFVFSKQGRFSLLFNISLDSLSSSLNFPHTTNHDPWDLFSYHWASAEISPAKPSWLICCFASMQAHCGLGVPAKLCILETLANIHHISVEIKCSTEQWFLGWATCTLLPASTAACSSEHSPDTIRLFSLCSLRFIHEVSWIPIPSTDFNFHFFSLECNPSKSLAPVQKRVSTLSGPLCRHTAVTTLLPAKFSEGQFQYAI